MDKNSVTRVVVHTHTHTQVTSYVTKKITGGDCLC